MTLQRVRVRSVPLPAAMITGAWAGFVPGLFIGALLGVLISFGAGAALEWMRELSFTTGIQQQLLPFGDRIGLLQTLQDGWLVVIPLAAVALGLFSAIFGTLTGALVAATFGSVLHGVEVDVEPMAIASPTAETTAAAAPAPAPARKRRKEYNRAAGDS
jgi:hypothetical protein